MTPYQSFLFFQRVDFLRVLHHKKPSRIPVWFMRQAGRYIPEYRELRKRYSFYELLEDSSLSKEITLLPLKYLDVDALILFSDLLVILWGFGGEFTYSSHGGPRILNRGGKKFSLKRFSSLKKSIQEVKRECSLPLIGFAPAPFTLACYYIEKEYRRDFPKTRELLYKNPEEWCYLMEMFSSAIISFLLFQKEAGIDAFMLFDSWVSLVEKEMFAMYVFPYLEKIIEALSFPGIYFSTLSSHLFSWLKKLPVHGIGIDWRVSIREAIGFFEGEKAIQGNLDPALLLGDWEKIQQKLQIIYQERKNYPFFIFNLGHGVLPDTPIENLQRIIQEVHSWEV